MTNTPTWNVEKTVNQIEKLEKAGCEIIRVGIPDLRSAKALGEIKKKINIPLVADIHYSASLAQESINQGVDKIRINPGNFPKSELTEIVKLCKKRKIPIRIGVNSGSLEREILKGHKIVTAEMIVESALKNIRLIENLGFYDLIISLKAPDVWRTIRAYEMLAEKGVDYPFHLGITEAGPEFSGTIKSAMGIGYLLIKGIGDTIRVSLTSDPIKEVKVGWEILKNLGLREKGVKIVSCPSCARTEIDVEKIAKEVEKLTQNIKQPLQIAIMGCIVNGLGEAREADLGIVGVKDGAIIAKGGKILRKISKEKILEELKKEIKLISNN
jgi:(E)-4-hydroxy-3-methylbut-2-enyl-diphosphate synthase